MSDTATISVADVQRLMQQRDIARAARDRARALAADLEGLVQNERVILREAIQLLRWAVTPTTSHAVEEQVGADIAAFLREHGEVAS